MRTQLVFRTAIALVAAWIIPIGLAMAGGPDDKVWKQVEMVRIWKLTEVLNLDESEMPKIVPLVKDYNEAMRLRAHEREDVLRDLKAEYQKEKGQDEKAIKDDIKKILQLESELMSVRQDHYKKMEEVLSPERLAKYMVFEVRFHDEIQNFMSDMTHKRNFSNTPPKKPGQTQNEPPPASGKE
jgi:hypothetical protein